LSFGGFTSGASFDFADRFPFFPRVPPPPRFLRLLVMSKPAEGWAIMSGTIKEGAMTPAATLHRFFFGDFCFKVQQTKSPQHTLIFAPTLAEKQLYRKINATDTAVRLAVLLVADQLLLLLPDTRSRPCVWYEGGLVDQVEQALGDIPLPIGLPPPPTDHPVPPMHPPPISIMPTKGKRSYYEETPQTPRTPPPPSMRTAPVPEDEDDIHPPDLPPPGFAEENRHQSSAIVAGNGAQQDNPAVAIPKVDDHIPDDENEDEPFDDENEDEPFDDEADNGHKVGTSSNTHDAPSEEAALQYENDEYYAEDYDDNLDDAYV